MPTTRRAVLGLAVAGGLAGCTRPATTDGDQPRPLTPTPTPDAALLAAAAAERQLAGWLSGVVAQAGRHQVPGPVVPVLRALAAAHAEHARMVRRMDPLAASGPASATPTPAAIPAAPWARLREELSRREAALHGRHTAMALRTQDPTRALLGASLATFAAAHRRPAVAPVDRGTRPAEVAVGTADEARLALLARLRALAEGLEVGAGQLDGSSAAHAAARARLDEVWRARDAVIAQLVAAGTEVPPAELGYRMPGGFRDLAATRRTWAALEEAVLAGWARLCAATTGGQREQALARMVAQAQAVRANGGALDWWPGWV